MAENISLRPNPLPINFDPIPSELRSFNQWVLWRYVWRNDKNKWDKPPFQPDGKLANTADALTWSSFEKVKSAYEAGQALSIDNPKHFDGIGFVLKSAKEVDLQIIGMDLDHCRDKESGEITSVARDIISCFGSYSEISPSGNGIRIFIKGVLPEGRGGRRKGNIELYQSNRYLTITGQRLPEYSATIEKRSSELLEFYEEVFGTEALKPSSKDVSTEGFDLSDDQIIELASYAKNKNKFLSLMAGSTSGYSSASEADLALCNILAFYTIREEQIDRIFRRSGLNREKWDREDYRRGTISKALNIVTKHYCENRSELMELNGPTVVDAIKALAIPNGNTSDQDRQGFSTFDHENLEGLIDKVLSGNIITRKEETSVYAFLKKYKKKLKALGIDYDTIAHIPRTERADDFANLPYEDLPQDIVDEALGIAEQGNPLKYMLETFNESHIGDTLLAETQFIAFGLQSALNTKGVFEVWSGPSGKGKSDGAKACARQLPSEYVLAGSITAKSLYHHADDLLDAGIIYLDDLNIEAGSDLEGTLKRIQTEFQEGAYHEWLDAQRHLQTKKLPKRMLVVRTYVDSNDADNQILNRSLNLGVASTEEVDNQVCDLILGLGERGETTDLVTRRTLVCRALWKDIKGQVYRVIMPGVKSLVHFSDARNRRNPSLFLDMVVGLACIRHRQRDMEPGKNGETLLYASFEDYQEAARIFNSQGDYLSSRLDKVERDAVIAIMDAGDEGVTIKNMLNILMKKFPDGGWNDKKVRRLLFGRKDREIGGLADKVPGLISEEIPSYSYGGRPVKILKFIGEGSKFDLFGLNVKVSTPEEKSLTTAHCPNLTHIFPKTGPSKTDSSSYNISSSCPNTPADIAESEKEGVGLDLYSDGEIGSEISSIEPMANEKVAAPSGGNNGEPMGKKPLEGETRTCPDDMPTPGYKVDLPPAGAITPRTELQCRFKETLARWEVSGRPITIFELAETIQAPDLETAAAFLLGSGYKETEELGRSGFKLWKKPQESNT